MTDSSTDNNSGQAAGSEPTQAGEQYPVGHLSPAPVEQPYFVPTPHQQAWSVAQQYGTPQFSSDPGAQFYPAAQYPAPGQYGAPAQYGQFPPPPGGGTPYWANGQYWSPPPVPVKKPRHKVLYGSLAAAMVTALAVGGIAFAVDNSHNGSSQQTALTTPGQVNPFGQNGSAGSGSLGSGSTGSGSTGSGSSNTTGTANATQSIGVVDINTTLDYGTGKAAGTGLVLTANGEILTNNHVVEDSTAISVVVVSTGKTYTGTVVGTDATDDIAVIQLKDASGLATAKLDTSTTVAVGTSVVAVGNAGGTGGTPSSATGTVTAINQSITASDESGANSERLTGMIETDADIQAGDSGGPLYSTASGGVIGIDTAASSASSGGAGRFGQGTGTGATSTDTTGFAIPIAKALNIAHKITNGEASTTVHLGYPAFLGVQFAAAAEGTAGAATIAGVVSGQAAAQAGLVAGDTITAVDSTPIASSTALSTELATHKPGDQVKISYTDASGASHSTTVTLGSGPAD